MTTLFDLPSEPEEGRVPTPLRLSSRKRALLEWVRANGETSSDAVPLGMSAKDLRELELEGLLVGEGAQVRVYRVATGGAR